MKLFLFLFSFSFLSCQYSHYSYFVLGNPSNEEEINYCCKDDACKGIVADIEINNNYNVKDNPLKLTLNRGDRGHALKKPFNKKQFWYIEVNGKKGYVSGNYVKTLKTYVEANDCINKTETPFRSSPEEGSDSVSSEENSLKHDGDNVTNLNSPTDAGGYNSSSASNQESNRLPADSSSPIDKNSNNDNRSSFSEYPQSEQNQFGNYVNESSVQEDTVNISSSEPEQQNSKDSLERPNKKPKETAQTSNLNLNNDETKSSVDNDVDDDEECFIETKSDEISTDMEREKEVQIKEKKVEDYKDTTQEPSMKFNEHTNAEKNNVEQEAPTHQSIPDVINQSYNSVPDSQTSIPQEGEMTSHKDQDGLTHPSEVYNISNQSHVDSNSAHIYKQDDTSQNVKGPEHTLDVTTSSYAYNQNQETSSANMSAPSTDDQNNQTVVKQQNISNLQNTNQQGKPTQSSTSESQKSDFFENEVSSNTSPYPKGPYSNPTQGSLHPTEENYQYESNNQPGETADYHNLNINNNKQTEHAEAKVSGVSLKETDSIHSDTSNELHSPHTHSNIEQSNGISDNSAAQFEKVVTNTPSEFAERSKLKQLETSSQSLESKTDSHGYKKTVSEYPEQGSSDEMKAAVSGHTNNPSEPNSATHINPEAGTGHTDNPSKQASDMRMNAEADTGHIDNPSKQSSDIHMNQEEASKQNSENFSKNKIISDETTSTIKQGQQAASSDFYSPISVGLSFFSDLFVSSKFPEHHINPTDQVLDEKVSTPATVASHGYCFDNEVCGGIERPIGAEDRFVEQGSFSVFGKTFYQPEQVPLTFNSMFYITITSVVMLLFSLGYYYIEKSQRFSGLIVKVNSLSQELFRVKVDRDNLEEQLSKIKETEYKQDSKVEGLAAALRESEFARVTLEDNVAKLEKEVETLMENGIEMHKLLSETITDEERSQMLLANITELKESLNARLQEIVYLTEQLGKKNDEIQLLQIDVRNATERQEELERKLKTCRNEVEEESSHSLQELQQKIITLQQFLEEKSVSEARLENELIELRGVKDGLDARVTTLEGALQQAHGVGTGEARSKWLDVTQVRTNLTTLNQQNISLNQHIEQLTQSTTVLNEKIKLLQEDIKLLNLKYEDAEKEKVNALTKLQVLSDYFKEKESKLQDELGMKESQWLQKESEDHTIYEQMKALRDEIVSYKSQNETLKAEILEQERSYKVQLANQEQKTYDNWVAFRHAERKIKELQIEASHFRNRLTQMESSTSLNTSEILPNPSVTDLSGKVGFGSAPSPPFMLLPPPPPNEFYPLPPLPHSARPPPLGRISSPPLPNDMIPPPPLIPFPSEFLPPSSTPPPPPLFKPEPRERPPKDSPPSNYSSESVNDKPIRRYRR